MDGLSQKAWHSMDNDDVCKTLDVDKNLGLDTNQVGVRLDKYGLNQITQKKSVVLL